MLVYIPSTGNGDSDLHGASPVPSSLTALLVARDAVIMSKGTVGWDEFVSEVPSHVVWVVDLPGSGRVVHGREVERVVFVEWSTQGRHVDWWRNG